MLQLSRKPGQDIIIGDNIIVRFIDSRTVGVIAPADVSVHRAEVYERNTGKTLPAASRETDDIMSADR